MGQTFPFSSSPYGLAGITPHPWGQTDFAFIFSFVSRITPASTGQTKYFLLDDWER